MGLLLVLLNELLGFDHLIQGNAAIRGSASILVIGGDGLELIGAMELGGSAEQAKLHAETEFEKYRIVQDRLFMSDYDKYLIELEHQADQSDV